MLPQLSYLPTLLFGRYIYILSRCLWTFTINIFSLKSSVKLDFTQTLPVHSLKERLILINLTMGKRGFEYMEERRKQLHAQHYVHQGGSLVISPPRIGAKPGAHSLLSKGTSRFLWCGCWEVNFSLASLRLCQLFIQLIVLLCLQPLTAEPQCPPLPSAFVGETGLSPVTRRSNFPLSHKSPSLRTIT